MACIGVCALVPNYFTCRRRRKWKNNGVVFISGRYQQWQKDIFREFLPDGFGSGVPQKVMFFSAEDSFEYTLKRRLRKNGAKLENIVSMDIKNESEGI